MTGLATDEQKCASLHNLHLQSGDWKKPFCWVGRVLVLEGKGFFSKSVDKEGSFLYAGKKVPTGKITEARGLVVIVDWYLLIIALRSGRAEWI